MSKRKTVYLMIGLTGSGKSTLGNCLLNKSGDLKKITADPFGTSNSSTGCTKEFSVIENDEFIVIDTIGFGDPQFAENDILDNLRRALNKVDNKIDCILFTVNQGRFSRAVVEFFETIHVKVFKNNCINNSILISIGGNEKDWIQKEKQDNTFVQNVLEKCNNTYFEFNLKFDHIQDDEEDRKKNFKKRQNSIDNLLSFLKVQTKSLTKIQLSYIQGNDFLNEWKEIIFPLLIKILTKYFNNDLKAIDLLNEGSNVYKKILDKNGSNNCITF